MPRKVDDSRITAKMVKELIVNGPSSTRKLAKIAGTSSPMKVRQIAKIAGTASYWLADQTMKEVSKLPLERDVLNGIENAMMIPNVIEVKDAPDIVTLEPMPVFKTRINISPEVDEAISRSGVLSHMVRGKDIKVQFSKKLVAKARKAKQDNKPINHGG